MHDRGQVFIDLALTLILGGEAISDFQGLRHLAPVIGPVASTSTVCAVRGRRAAAGPGQHGGHRHDLLEHIAAGGGVRGVPGVLRGLVLHR